MNISQPISTTPSKSISSKMFEVICRLRPLQSSEQNSDISVNDSKPTIAITEQSKNTTKQFTFHKVYQESTPQFQVTKEISDEIFWNCLQNGTASSLVLSYGVTNSGKTYTILGTQQEPGLLPSLIERAINQFPQERIKLTAIQSYNDQFYSLENKMRLLPRQLYGTYEFDDYQPEVVTLDTIGETLRQCMKNRSQADTKANKNSSRSHAIFKITCDSISIAIVDLAGSQRLNKTCASVEETRSINSSLLVLGRCIHACRDRKIVPYRESKLTKVLAEYFTMKCKIFMVVHLNRSGQMFHENLNVLEYAAVSMTVKHLNPQVNKSIMKSVFKKEFKKNLYEKNMSTALEKQLSKSGLKKKIKKEEDDVLQKAIYEEKKQHKKQAMEIFVSNMFARMDEFEFYLDREFQKQDQRDHAYIIQMKNLKYQSPQKEQETKEQINEAHMRIDIRKEILEEIRLQKQRILVQCGTGMGPSIKKAFQQSQTQMGPSMKKLLEESFKKQHPEVHFRLNNQLVSQIKKQEDKDESPNIDQQCANPQTPVKSQDLKQGKNIIENILEKSEKCVKSACQFLGKAVQSVRDLSRKKDKKREIKLTLISRQVSQKITGVSSKVDRHKSSAISIMEIIDRLEAQSQSEEHTSFLLESLNSSKDEDGNKVYFDLQEKPNLNTISQKEEFQHKNSPFFAQVEQNQRQGENSFSQNTKQNEIQKEILKDKDSTIDDKYSGSFPLSQIVTRKFNKKLPSVASTVFSSDNGDKKNERPKQKKPMRFKVHTPSVSPIKTRHQRRIGVQKKNRIA